MNYNTHLKLITVIAVFGLFLAGCGQAAEESGTGELSGTLTISGAWALYPMMVRWSEEFHSLYPDVEFDT